MATIPNDINEIEDFLTEAKKYDLMYATLGNGVTITNKAEEEHGDYKKVAHIDPNRKITWYDKSLPSNLKKEIEKYTREENPDVSASQKGKKVFKENLDEAIEWEVIILKDKKKITQKIKLGDKSDNTDVKNQIKRMGIGGEILSIKKLNESSDIRSHTDDFVNYVTDKKSNVKEFLKETK